MTELRFSLALFVGFAAACARPPEPASRPNVLVLSVDTLRADALESYGYVKPTSPQLDELARTSTVFEQAISSAPWTLPSVASIFTSYYSSTHNCWSEASMLDGSFDTLAEVLCREGYDTACFVSHPFLTTQNGMQQGFVHFDYAFTQLGTDAPDAISSVAVSEGGIDYLEEKVAVDDSVPWFLWLHYFDPHTTYMPHEGVTERFVERGTSGVELQRGIYDGEVALVDREIGRVLEVLEQNGLTENTIVVFVSDHGEEFEEHGTLAHGKTLYQEVIRVPFFVRAPGHPPGRVQEPVRTVDLMPTLLDLVGLDLPPAIEGRSLVPFLKGGRISLPPALMELRRREDRMLEGLVQGRWKLIRRLDDSSLELYDLESDPGETRDVATEHPEVVDELGERLKKLVLRARERAGAFSISPAEELSEGQLEVLRGLGYIGDD